MTQGFLKPVNYITTNKAIRMPGWSRSYKK